MQHVEICRIWLWDGFQSKTFNYFRDIFKIIKKTAVVLAKFWIPVHSVNVKQHCSAGVGHVRAVDAAWLPPRQTLMDKHTQSFSLQIRRQSRARRRSSLTHMSQESTVPNMARWDTTASWTSSTLSISQRSFTALKYVLIGSPVLCCRATTTVWTPRIVLLLGKICVLWRRSPSGGSCSSRGFCWWDVRLSTESAGPTRLHRNTTVRRTHNRLLRRRFENLTDGVVERLARLFVPNKRRLSLVGHSDS